MIASNFLLIENNDALRDAMRLSLVNIGVNVLSMSRVSETFEQIMKINFDGIAVGLDIQLADARPLAALILHFQPTAFIAGISDLPTLREINTARLLLADAVVRPCNVTQLVELLDGVSENGRFSSAPASGLRDSAGATRSEENDNIFKASREPYTTHRTDRECLSSRRFTGGHRFFSPQIMGDRCGTKEIA
jgi:hypothetical protein